MKNCLIMGAGRSGTSMLAGALAPSGYFMGDKLWAGRESNPLGFYEDAEVNAINEALISRVSRPRPRGPLGYFFAHRPQDGQRWLACVPMGTDIPRHEPLQRRIEEMIAREPYCLKDPRFCYTLPAWKPHLRDAVFICVFREPGRTVDSIVKECSTAKYLRSLKMTRNRAMRVWLHMYGHVLDRHRNEGIWIFVHYDQLANGSAVSRIEDVLKARLERSFIRPELRRSVEVKISNPSVENVYSRLCNLASYARPSSRTRSPLSR